MPHKPGFIHSGKDENSWNYFELPFGSGADYVQPIPVENLPYTPAVLGEMLENKEREREIEIEGLGKGRLVISKQNKNKPFFYADEANIPANKKAAKQLQIAETLVNAPVQLAPFLAPFGAKSKPTNVILKQPGKTQKVPITKGGQTIFQQRKSNKQTLKRLKTEERIEDVTGFGDKSIIIDDVMSQRPFTTAEVVKVAKRNKISFVQAEEYLKLKNLGTPPKGTIKPDSTRMLAKGEGTYDPTVYIPPEERPGNEFQYFGPVKQDGPNYSAIEGSDVDSGNFNWLAARTGKPYHFDISGHRIFEVPGMQNDKEAIRYKNWLTNSLVQRFKDQTVVPDKQITFFHSNKDFIDSKGNPWQLVRANKRAKGPNQTYIPTPKVEVDSRKMKKQNTNNEEKVLLAALMRQNVSQRNSFEKRYPWLREWISESTGQNYHEHMYGLDETEFWKSGYGKSLGYMNNDVYDLEKGLGNIVFLQDPRFKKAKDAVGDIITPGKKIQIYPGLKRRLGAVRRFTAGKYKGLNAIVGYDADPTSSTYTDLTIVAYDPDPNVVFGERVTTIPNYYSLVFAKLNGKRLIDDVTAKGFLEQYVTAVLNDDQPKIILLTDFAEALPKIYPELKQAGLGQIPPGDFEIPEPSGLNLDPDFRSVGKYSKKDPDPDPLQEKVFKMDNALQRKRDAYMKRLLIKLKKGTYTQLDFINLLFYDE